MCVLTVAYSAFVRRPPQGLTHQGVAPFHSAVEHDTTRHSTITPLCVLFQLAASRCVALRLRIGFPLFAMMARDAAKRVY